MRRPTARRIVDSEPAERPTATPTIIPGSGAPSAGGSGVRSGAYGRVASIPRLKHCARPGPRPDPESFAGHRRRFREGPVTLVPSYPRTR